MELRQLLQKRNWYESLVQLHSGPWGLERYRNYYENEIIKIDNLIAAILAFNETREPDGEAVH